MPAALKWDSKIILAKTEVTEGVDVVPAAADGILATNVTFTPMEGKDLELDYELPYLSADPTVPVGLMSRLKLRTMLSGSGTRGTAPAWGRLLTACGVQEVVTPAVSVVYTPISGTMNSLTMYLWTELTRHRILCTRGNAKIVFPVQEFPYIEFDFLGLYTTPTETARVTPTNLANFKNPLPVTHAMVPSFSINAVPLKLRNLSLDLGNKVEPRLLLGGEYVAITDRSDMIKMQVEATPLGTFNPYLLAAPAAGAPVPMAVTLTHGSVAGSIVNLAAPAFQMGRPEQPAIVQKLIEWPLSGPALPVNGNDQWSLTLT